MAEAGQPSKLNYFFSSVAIAFGLLAFLMKSLYGGTAGSAMMLTLSAPAVLTGICAIITGRNTLSYMGVAGGVLGLFAVIL